MAVAGDEVYVRGSFRGRSKATGRTWETRWVHVFRVDGDRLARWDGYLDSAAAVAAHAS
jgi:ketosteroid isomerase-like protein